jgi:hypothetical protein
MWFLVGMVTVALATLGLAFWRGSTHWRGDRKVDGCEAKAGVHKGKLRSLAVGARTVARVEFELKPEGMLDRWAKGIGLSVEGEIGHGHFDRELYLVADDPHVSALLRRETALADALLELFGAGGPGVTKVQRVICRGGVLRVEMKTNADSGEALDISSRFTDSLRHAAGRLGQAAGSASRPDPLWNRATLLRALAGGLAVNGAVQWLRVGVVPLPATIEDGTLWAIGLPAGLLLLATMVVATIVWLGRSSRTHLVLAEVLLVGGFGAIATAFTEVRDLNIEADGSEATTYTTQIVDRRTHRGRRGRRSWSVTLGALPGSDGPQRIKVSSAEYDRYTIGTPVDVQVHRGYLGAAWIESFGPARSR